MDRRIHLGLRGRGFVAASGGEKDARGGSGLVARTARILLQQMAIGAVVLAVTMGSTEHSSVRPERFAAEAIPSAGCTALQAAVSGLPSLLSSARSRPAVAAIAATAEAALRHISVPGRLHGNVDELLAGIDQWSGLVALHGTAAVRGAGLFSRLAVALSELSSACPTGGPVQPLDLSGVAASGARRA
jgi:hypothetical protein